MISSGIVSTAGITAPSDSGIRHRRKRHANNVDEKGGLAVVGRGCAFEHLHVVDKIVAGQPGIAQDYNQAGDCVCAQHRNGGVRRIFEEGRAGPLS
jgi:hypothetical protein